jgi:hypothetical protein
MNFSETLIQLDDTIGEIEYTFSDTTPIWPILRWQLRVAAMQQPDGDLGIDKKPSRKSGYFTLSKTILHAWFNKPVIPANTEILSIAHYEGNQEIPNRMTVFLKEIAECTKLEWLYCRPDRLFPSLPHTQSFDYFFYRALWLVKWKKIRNSDKQIAAIEAILDNAKKHLADFVSETQWQSIKQNLLFIDRIISHYRDVLKSTLKKNKPKLIIVSEGNNGEWKQAVLFQVAKELGIPTAEVQHGVFNMGMKYGPKLAASPALKAMKSDYELVFGPYHTALTNAPVRCIPFGHYDLEQALKRLQNNPPEKKGKAVNITLIGEGIPPSSVENGLLRHTLSALQQWKQSFKLCIRLHPSELPDAKYEPFFQFHGTHYSELKDESIYDVINNTDILISHASTVVFEALYFQKNVCVLRDDNTAVYVPEGVGLSFRDTESLLELLNQLATGKEITKSNANDYWSTEGVSLNFRNFWKKQILK